MATLAQLRKGLAATTVPDDVAAGLLSAASPLWLSSDSATQLAEDLALCYPPLNPAEVRARAVSGDDAWRLTVVAHDRRGLLADTAAILAAGNYSVRAASVATWSEANVALHAITLAGAGPSDEELDKLGGALRRANGGKRPTFTFSPAGKAYVQRTGDANGDPMISVVAPDQPGLLAAICRFFSEAGASIEAAWITGEDEANDVFVVQGDVDVAALERRLSAEPEGVGAVVDGIVHQARAAGEAVVTGVGDFVRGLVTKK